MATRSSASNNELREKMAAVQKQAPAASRVPALFTMLRNPAMLKQIGMSLPVHLKNNAEKYARQMMTLAQLNPELLNCEPNTVLGALMNASALGLELAPSLQQCYIIPRWNSKSGCKQAQFQLGYRGMLALAYQSPKIRSIVAKEVCEGDEFEADFGPNGTISHKAKIRGKRGAPYAYYAYAVLDSGQLIFDVMSYEDMYEFAKANSDSFGGKYSNGPWKDHFDEMAKKTMLKKIWKLLPLATEAKVAEAADEGIKHVTEKTDAENIMEMQSEYLPPHQPEAGAAQPVEQEKAEAAAALPDLVEVPAVEAVPAAEDENFSSYRESMKEE